MNRFSVFAFALLIGTPALAQDLPGKATFTTYCATCHGASGKGDGAAAAALNPKPRNFTSAEFWASTSDENLTKVIKEGGMSVGKSPLMAPWGGVLTDAQIAEVVAYLKTFNPGAAAPAAE